MEQSIGHKSDIHIHWQTHSPINERLQAVVEPLTDNFAQALEHELQAATPEARQEMVEEAGNVYTLPYGRMGNLPPALFGDISDERILLRKALVVPTAEKDIQGLADGYQRWAERITRSNKYHRSSYPNSEGLVKAMDPLKGMAYPHDEWLASARAMQLHLRNDQIFAMDRHRSNRALNAALDYDQLNAFTAATHRPYESYVLVMSRKTAEDGWTSGTRDFVQLPIGAYGVEAAGKLARATVALSDFIKASPMVDAGVRELLTPETENLLAEHTARSRERHEASMPDFAVHGVKETLTEGILSMAQTISFLTAEKVDGYEDYDKLVEAILDSDVIEQFTRIVHAGYVGPVALSGLYIPGALVVRNGELALSKEAMSVLSGMRKARVAKVAAEWALYHSTGGTSKKPQVLGLHCPAAAPNGAITRARGPFKALYNGGVLEAA